MDCFYAAVELRDNPALQGRPVAVGGRVNQRGVLTTANYEARQFGLRSAMSTATALRLCPELVLLPVAMEKYRQESRRIHQILADYSDTIEPISLDEAFLDVTHSTRCNARATGIATEIRERIRDEIGLTASAGVSINKFLAKVASDWQKPDGLTVILPHQVDRFVAELPVAKLWGVGPANERKLMALGVRQCGQLRAYSEAALVNQFGVFGKRLFQLCRGIDNRPVSNDRRRRSISVESTFAQDISTPEALYKKLPKLYQDLVVRYRRQEARYRPSGVFVKLKFNDFQSTSANRSGRYFLDEALLLNEYRQLITEAWQRRQLPVRLLGIGFQVEPLEAAAFQADLFRQS